MEAIGIIRKMDDLGRVVIPREICNRMGIKPGTPLGVLDAGDSIIIKKYIEPTPQERMSKLIGMLNEDCKELESQKADHVRVHIAALEKLLNPAR